MSDMPEDIWEQANEIYRLIANPTKLEKMAQLLTPVERIAYALWAERKNAVEIGKEIYKFIPERKEFSDKLGDLK